jgi:hypothetical protein
VNRFLIILTVFLSLKVVPNFAQTNPNTFWLVKPNLKADTIALINNRVKKINLYLHEISDVDPQKKSYYGTWTITSDTNKIVSIKWIGADKIPYWHFYMTFTSKNISKRKITETSDSLDMDDNEFKMIHYLNSKNNVKRTNFYCFSVPQEDSYNSLSRIYYKYSEGLLIEADYYYNWRFLSKNYCQLKYYFTYE